MQSQFWEETSNELHKPKNILSEHECLFLTVSLYTELIVPKTLNVFFRSGYLKIHLLVFPKQMTLCSRTAFKRSTNVLLSLLYADKKVFLSIQFYLLHFPLSQILFSCGKEVIFLKTQKAVSSWIFRESISIFFWEA